MKIVTWNCNGAFRNKFESISDFNADVYIIQECENPAECKHLDFKRWAHNYIWTGDTKNKGLAIFGKSNIKFEKLDWPNNYKNHSVKHFLPCRINNHFNLLAVWTHKNNSPNFGYIGQLWKYLQLNKDKLNETLIAGDFNSNKIWDEWDRWWNHTDVVEELANLGIVSVYHEMTAEYQGKETTPTLYFQRNINKPYHIDYIFATKYFINQTKKFEIGQPDKWLSLSDHMPIFYELETTTR